jgi:hypothetical protein
MAMSSYCVCAVVVSMVVTPQRATANTIGLALTPFFAGFAAAVGLLLGFLIRIIWSMATRKEWTGASVRVGTIVLLLLSICAAGATGVTAAIAFGRERNHTSVVLRDTGAFRYVPAPSPLPACDRSTTLISPNTPSATVRWGDQETEIVLTDTEFLAKDKSSGRSCELPSEGLGSIRKIDAAPFVVANYDRPMLALVITDRENRDAIVAVLSPNYAVLYAERINAHWRDGQNPLGVIPDPESPGAQLGVLGPGGPSPRAFKMVIVHWPAGASIEPPGAPSDLSKP